ncbi:MAG: phosphotyrosine protein phosphatase [Crocinitomicaceae bacterium]
MKNILFVCSANKDRSKTADDYFSEKYPQYHVDSAGTNIKLCHKEGTNPMSEELAEWADEIIVMEKKHQAFVNSLSSKNVSKKIRVLNIPDYFNYYQKELIELLEEKVSF